MKDFPDFMKTSKNLVASKSQSIGVKGWVYDSHDGKQMAYWICKIDGVSKNVPHAGEFIAGRRTIHCFGGKRVDHA